MTEEGHSRQMDPQQQMSVLGKTGMAGLAELERTLRRREETIRDLEKSGLRKDEQIKDLEKTLRRKEEMIRSLEKNMKQQLKKTEELTSKLDKCMSVMKPVTSRGSLTVEVNRKRAVGVSAESGQELASSEREESQRLSKKVAKTSRTRKMIESSILGNDFLRNLSTEHIETIIDYMYLKEFRKDSMIITEGSSGSHIYVLEEGEVEVMKGGQRICSLGPGKVIGELAILYNCTRTASIRALTNCKMWTIDRKIWQGIIIRLEQKKRHSNMKLLKRIPRFQSHSEQSLSRIVDILEEEHFDRGHHIVRQGAVGDTFFIVSTGTVIETRQESSDRQPKTISTLKAGDFFGEDALDAEEIRTSNFVAGDPDGATCLILDRDAYEDLLEGINDGKRLSVEQIARRQSSLARDLEFRKLSISDITVIGTIGVGGFSKVELVQLKDQAGRSFALKTLTKHHLVETHQQEHTINERKILAECKSDFIVRLYGTTKDDKYLYMLLEGCLGGELFSIMKSQGSLDESASRFYAGCVLEAFHYLHSRGIIYRDLKPENMMLDHRGYIKLTDFGFAKKIGRGQKTWTFCGTPEYIAPEIILNKGHDMSADLWSLGALVFELLAGRPLFSGSDQMQTYRLVLKGVGAAEFPRIIRKQAKNLIKKLCRENSSRRLGYGKGGIADIRKHKWYEGYNWEGLRKGTLQAPIAIQVRGPTDISNFDSYTNESDEIPPDYDDIVDWDPDF